MDFKAHVYRLCKQISKGKVSTYKELAKALNSKAYHVIGQILHNNYNSTIPCHRIVNSNGELGGFNKGLKAKIGLFKKGGVVVKRGKIVDFKNIRCYFR